MARAPQRARGGPGFVGMIVFLVLSLVLIGGYAFLVPGFLKAKASLTQLQRSIKSDLEDPLRGKGLDVGARAVASPLDAAYDDTFFNKVKAKALDGLQYAQLVEKVGFGTENTVAQITDELTKRGQDTLQSCINKLTTDAGDFRRQLGQANSDLTSLKEQRDQAQALQQAETDRLKAAREKAEKDLQTAKADYEKSMSGMKQITSKAEDDAKKAWAENRQQAETYKKQIAGLQANIDQLTEKVDQLNKELQRKAPKEVAVTEGKVLQADWIEGVAIINLGRRERIENGERFTVVRVARGGARVPKGELQVVRVDDLVSTTEIIKSDKDDPIMRDDIVQRQKKTEEAMPAR